MSKTGDIATKFLINLGANAFQRVATDVVDSAFKKTGEVLGGIGDQARETTYNKYTDPFDVKTTQGAEQDKTGKWVRDNPRNVGAYYTDNRKTRKGGLRPEVPGDDPWNAPKYESDAGTWHGRKTKEAPPGTGWDKGFYDNPELAAQVAYYAAPTTAVMGTAGAALGAGWLLSDGKPKSSYSVPVQPSGGTNTNPYYNQSVESAMASASAKYELEEQKHAHNIELQMMRDQNRTPGKQQQYDPSMPNISSGGDPLGNPFGNTRTYFS